MGININDIFSNRELATAFWLTVAIILVLWSDNMRTSLRDVFSALLAPKLLQLFGSYAVWVSAIIFTLEQFGLWTVADLKATILWYLFSGAVLLGRSVQRKSGGTFFHDIMRDNFKIIIAVEFIVVAYSFSLFSELLFVPFMTALVALIAISETNEKYAQVKMLLEFTMIGIVFFLIWHFFQTSIENNGAIFSFATLRGVLLPIFLSVLSVPVFYLAYCYSNWESALIRINQKTYLSNRMKAGAKKRFFRTLFLQPELLNRAVRQFQMLPAENSDDLEQIIGEVREYEQRRKSPKTVDAEIGWSPFVAESFLKDDKLATNDYHRSGFDNEWFAESETQYLNGAGPFDSIIYRVKGNAIVANTLQLKGSFNTTQSPENGLQQFCETVNALICQATELEQIPREFEAAIAENRDVDLPIETHVLSIRFNEYSDANILDVEFNITVT